MYIRRGRKALLNQRQPFLRACIRLQHSSGRRRADERKVAARALALGRNPLGCQCPSPGHRRGIAEEIGPCELHPLLRIQMLHAIQCTGCLQNCVPVLPLGCLRQLPRKFCGRLLPSAHQDAVIRAFHRKHDGTCIREIKQPPVQQLMKLREPRQVSAQRAGLHTGLPRRPCRRQPETFQQLCCMTQRQRL